uniref:solute carrier family 2, facilitated glucose transporter member 5-like n=1 Tax=Podarcis muralis TaxID=64176 RepID=UPI0010A0B9C9|nr:solute carrier family 2, facilitated glucose transporter member 5-like [Podarcis muralis]
MDRAIPPIRQGEPYFLTATEENMIKNKKLVNAALRRRDIQEFFNLTGYTEMQVEISAISLVATETTFLFFGNIAGALAVGWLVERFGRKGALVITNFLSITSTVVLLFSRKFRFYGCILFTFFYSGICSGITFGVVPLYLLEISPKSLRGGITMMHHLFSSLGYLLFEILALQQLLGDPRGIPILATFPVIMPVLQSFMLPYLPESPRYLFIQRKDVESARQALKKLRERDDVEDEIQELKLEDITEKQEKNMNPLKLLRTPSLRREVFPIVALIGGEHLNALNSAYYYSQRIYLAMGVETDNIQLTVIGGIVFYCCATAFTAYLADSKGHRLMLLIGFGMSIISCVLLTLSLELQATFPEMVYFSSVVDLLFIFGEGLGTGPIPPVIVMELFLQSSRSSALVIAGIVHWLTSYLADMTTIYAEAYIGAFIFLLFWPISVATIFYIFRYVPETKNRTFVGIRRRTALKKAVKIHIQKQAEK